jgi:hypothetical protein
MDTYADDGALASAIGLNRITGKRTSGEDTDVWVRVG